MKAYDAFEDNTFFDEDLIVETKVFDNKSFGYNKITVERPSYDENGKIITKKNKPVANSKLRDYENIPLKESIDEYFKREVLPYVPNAWVDKTKTKIGYEIPMTRYFYKYQAPEPVEDIVNRIHNLEADINKSLEAIFDTGAK
jgi:type I restriction enzyme M protein